MRDKDNIDALLADLDTITDVAKAGVISRSESRLEPGEKRFAAILFLDIVGFTELSKKLSPENLTQLVDRTFRIFDLSVKGQGGYCDKVIGDAALYVFPGHPNHPPACEAALRAAVMLLDRARQIGESLKPTGLALSIRVGISFGEVARKQVGGDMQQTVMGDTVNIAQRLEESALPGTVQTTVRVLERAGELTISEVRGKMQFKGFGDVEVHQVWRFKPSPVQLRGSFRRLSPLIGRDDLMAEALDTVKSWLQTQYPLESLDVSTVGTPDLGRNRLLVFRGVAAVGKSRLAYEVIEAMQKKMGLNTSASHCTPLASLSVFAAEMIQVAGINSENLPERWEELCKYADKKVSHQFANRMRAHLPMLGYLLDCDQVDFRGIKQADASSFLLEIKLAIRACCELIGLATENPVVLVIEDLQWMGELGDTITDILKNTALPQPLVIIATAREEFPKDREEIPSLFGERPGKLAGGEGAVNQFYSILDLQPLREAEGKELFKALLPGLKLPEEIEAELHEKAIGLPYYYEEFARMLVRRELVGQSNGRFHLAKEIAPNDLEIPEDIRMLILGRLDQLQPELRALAGRASVLGRSFLKGLLKKFEEKLGTTTPEELEKALADLNMHHVLAEETGDRYFFEHILTREAAYGALLRTNRVVLHRMAARVLTDLLIPGTAGEWEILPELVRHLETVEEYSAAHKRSCDMLLLMAHTGRYDQWASWETKAQKFWDNLRERESETNPVSANLLYVRGWQHYCLGRVDEAKNCYTQALEIAKRRNDRHDEATILNFLGTLYRNQGRMEESQESYEQAMEIMQETSDFLGEGTALRNLGILHMSQGRMEKARVAFERSLVIKRGINDRRGEAISLNNLGKLHRAQSRVDKARECFEQSLSIKRETSDRRGEGIALCAMGELDTDHGRLVEARKHFEDSLSIFREIGDRRREALVLNCVGALHQHLSQMEEAKQCYEMSLHIRGELRDQDGEGSTLLNLGTWFSEQGDVAVAEATQLQALAISHKLGSANLEGEVLAELGDVYRKQGRFDEAVTSLNQALEILEVLQDNYHLALAHCYFTQVYLDQKNIKSAKNSLELAKEAAGPIGAGPDSELGMVISGIEEELGELEKSQKEANA